MRHRRASTRDWPHNAVTARGLRESSYLPVGHFDLRRTHAIVSQRSSTPV